MIIVLDRLALEKKVLVVRTYNIKTLPRDFLFKKNLSWYYFSCVFQVFLSTFRNFSEDKIEICLLRAKPPCA